MPRLRPRPRPTPACNQIYRPGIGETESPVTLPLYTAPCLSSYAARERRLGAEVRKAVAEAQREEQAAEALEADADEVGTHPRSLLPPLPSTG